MRPHRPNLFIVGAAKSGTTALYHYLKQHPDIFMCPNKETGFFCMDFHKESDKYYGKKVYFLYRTFKQYEHLYKDAKDEKIIGEGSVDYFDSKVAAQLIHDYNPKAKIIIMLREPVSFLYSLHSENKYSSGEDIHDFEKAIEHESVRKKTGVFPVGVRWPSSLFYMERAGYTKKIMRFTKIFRKDQVKIIIYDDFLKDNIKVYKEILGFLDVDQNFIPKVRRHNPNKKIRFWKIQKLIFALTDTPIKKVLPLPVRRFIGDSIRKVNIKYEPRTALNEKVKRKFMKKFKPEVEELSRITGKDLVKIWGYDGV